jgi:hypothetical protein
MVSLDIMGDGAGVRFAIIPKDKSHQQPFQTRDSLALASFSASLQSKTPFLG